MRLYLHHQFFNGSHKGYIFQIAATDSEKQDIVERVLAGEDLNELVSTLEDGSVVIGTIRHIRWDRLSVEF